MPDTQPKPTAKTLPAGPDEPSVPEPRRSTETRTASPANPRRRALRWIGVLVAVLAIFGAGIGATLWATADEAPVGASPATVTTAAPGYTPTAGNTTQERNFLIEWHQLQPSVAGQYYDWYWLDMGKRMCSLIGQAGVQRYMLYGVMSSNQTLQSTGTAGDFVETAHRRMCGEKVYSAPLSSGYSAPSYTAPSSPTSVPGQFTSGTYEVGDAAGEIAPGKYVAAPGSSRCYFARLRNLDGGVGSIIDNQGEYSGGQVILSVQSSDTAVEISGDCTFVKR